MSTAKRFRQAGNQQEWLTIEDDAGAVWRYDQTNETPGPDVPYHVTWGDRGRQWEPVLVRDNGGHPILRQDEVGLPEKIVVAWDDPLNPATGGGIAQGTFIPAAKRLVFIQTNSN